MQRTTNKKSPRPIRISDKRCRRDRRIMKSEGYVKLSVVGWYCRRDKIRRNNDLVL